MRLVSTVQAGPMRHYFFEIGRGTRWRSSEVSDAPEFELPAGIPIPARPSSTPVVQPARHRGGFTICSGG